MRCIGRLSEADHAGRFRDYLLTRGIDSRIDEDGDGFAVWVLDEDRMEAARQELDAFQRDPQDSRYADAVADAARVRQQRLDEDLASRKRHIDLRRRWDRPVIHRIPITFLLIVLSGMATAATNFGEKSEVFDKLRTTSVDADGRYVVRPMLHEVREGEVWRVVTPIFVHLSVAHLLFNMYWLYLFGGLIEVTRGWWRYLGLVLAIAVVSNISQHLWSGPNFGGMSGVGYGLFGYLWFKTRFSPEEGYSLPQSTITMFVVWMLICMTDLIGPVANTAHVSGLIAGAVLAALGAWLRRFR